MQIRAAETAPTPTTAPADSGKTLEAARLHDRARHEKTAARFQRPLNWMGAGHHTAAALTRGSLSLAGRMLTALVLVLLVSLYVVNSPMETTYGLEKPLPWSGFDTYAGPHANDVLRNTPLWFAALFAGLTALFAAAAVLCLLLRATTGLGLRLLLRWAHHQGVEAAIPLRHP